MGRTAARGAEHRGPSLLRWLWHPGASRTLLPPLMFHVEQSLSLVNDALGNLISPPRGAERLKLRAASLQRRDQQLQRL
jgi:hypothetical protein